MPVALFMDDAPGLILLADLEDQYARLHRRTQQFAAGGLAEMFEILHRPRIGGEDALTPRHRARSYDIG